MIKFLRYVSSLLVSFSFLWAYEDGCMVNVVIAVIATALLCWTALKEAERCG